MLHESRDVTGVHLAGVVWNTAGQVDFSDDSYTVYDNRFLHLGKLTVAASLGSQVEDHRARGHAFHHVFGYEDGRLFAGDYGGGNHNILFGDYVAEQLALTIVETFVLRASVAAFILRVFGFNGKFDEAASETLHLLFGGWAEIVGGDNCSQAAGGGDCLQPGDSCAHDQHTRWRNGSGRGGQHGKNSGMVVCGAQHGFVSADGAHGGECVHGLGAGGARHQLD